MSYLSQVELELLGFKKLGRGVRISKKASIYDAYLISLGDFVRVDDFCIISGNVTLGRSVSLAPYCLIAGGNKDEDLQNGGILILENCVFAYGVKVFSRSDDYVNMDSKATFIGRVVINQNCIIGSNATIYPGSIIGQSCSIIQRI